MKHNLIKTADSYEDIFKSTNLHLYFNEQKPEKNESREDKRNEAYNRYFSHSADRIYQKNQPFSRLVSPPSD